MMPIQYHHLTRQNQWVDVLLAHWEKELEMAEMATLKLKFYRNRCDHCFHTMMNDERSCCCHCNIRRYLLDYPTDLQQ